MRTSREVSQESGAGWIRISLILLVAVMLKQIPWEGGWWLAMRPDFVLLALLFWALHRPSRVGMTTAFVLGLLSDFQDGVVFGQHAAAYVVGVYAVQYFRLRFLQFDAAQQAAQMLPILGVVQFTVLVIGWLAAGSPLGLNIFLPALSGTLLWFLIALIPQLLHGKKAMRN